MKYYHFTKGFISDLYRVILHIEIPYVQSHIGYTDGFHIYIVEMFIGDNNVTLYRSIHTMLRNFVWLDRINFDRIFDQVNCP